ncbi:amidohydrolase family protein [Mesorhizobium sp. M0938]|uniref:amidohydrolase family protein n=1 Tax=unclassified Mesorhizobium TaxID=325217 RepID=UPI00333A50DA
MTTDRSPSEGASVTHVKQARAVVGWDQEAGCHVYMRDVDIAFSRDGILHVGPNYDGPAAETIDGSRYLVMPGLVDIHSHPGEEPLNKGLWDEVGSPRLYNSSLYEYLTVLDRDADSVRACYGVALSELLLSGVTTLCDLAVPSEGWLDIHAESGLRVCVAPMFRSGRWLTRDGHRVEYEWDEAAGRLAFERALKEIDLAERHPSGRLTGMVAPAQIDTCSEGLLRDAYAEAERRSLPFQTHAAQSIVEFQEITRRHGLTPIGWMSELGVLGPRTIIGHGIFLDHHPWTHWERTGDLERLAEAGATVAHCPTVFARRGISLNHLGRYREAGVNIGIGTDVYPHNMLDEMRLAIYAARLTAGNPREARLADVFAASTVGGAKALGRDDIGRLSPGCKADIVLVDCTAPAMQPCRDPLRSLVFSASDRAVRHVYVDGRPVVREGRVLTIDHAAAAASLAEAQLRAMATIPRNDWAGRSADELSPPTLRWT